MRAAKLESARKMLKSHQAKKQVKCDEPNDMNSQNYMMEKCTDTSRNMEPKIETSIDCTADALEQQIHSQLLPTQTQHSQQNLYEYNIKFEEQLKAVEILTSDKRYLEIQVQDLQNKILHINGSYMDAINTINQFKTRQELAEKEIPQLKEAMNKVTQELLNKNQQLEEQSNMISSISDKNKNLLEQLEIMKTALVSKEAENGSLNSQLERLERELDLTKLYLQQLTNDGPIKTTITPDTNIEEEYDVLVQKLKILENKYKYVVNEKEQIKVDYEQYSSELSKQLISVKTQNNELYLDNNELRDRERSLIEQLSKTEIIIQQLNRTVANHTETSQPLVDDEYKNLQEKHVELEISFKNLEKECYAYKEELKQLKVTQLEQENAAKIEPAIECSHIAQDIDLSKLHADIASDKIAAQMATTQNIQLKKEVEDLKELHVKMSQDKLDLIEKLDAEKFLNRQLTLKLSEIDENAKYVNTKLLAKDKEMIRILSNYNDLENKYLEQTQELNNLHKSDIVSVDNDIDDTSELENNNLTENSELLQNYKKIGFVTEESNNALNISIKEGMLKLQARFLRKMEELAELSDEKHRLEHIIMQLQSETDTICEYVTLYQQQRGILKKREEERKEQLLVYEKERSRMQNQLDRLRNIISHFATDKDLEQYFQQGSRLQEVTKIIDIVDNLKTNHLIDPSKQCSELGSVYHCSWCSGKVLIV